MIYGIKIGQNFVLREAMRNVDRIENRLYGQVLVDVLYGASYDATNASKKRMFHLSLQRMGAGDIPADWTLLKDAANQQLIQNIYDIFIANAQALLDYQAYENDPEAYLETPPTEPSPAGTFFEHDKSLFYYMLSIEPNPANYEVIALG